jgi:ABC-type protease/lipase transport system fused ATPase/permease subunit
MPANLQNLQNVNPADIDPNGLAGLFMAYAMQLQQVAEAQQAADRTGGGQPGGNVLAKNLSFHPPGSEKPLLDNVSFNLKPNQLGLIIGRSGECASLLASRGAHGTLQPLQTDVSSTLCIQQC